MAKAPEVGDRIEHTCTLNGRREGIVLQLLSQQFTYKTDEGHERFCMYREAWKLIEEG